jgi:hypothetical protein
MGQSLVKIVRMTREPLGQFFGQSPADCGIALIRQCLHFIERFHYGCIRTTDICHMQHKHIEVIKRHDMQYLRMTLPSSKRHSCPIVIMPWAVKVYERIYERHKRELGYDPLPDQYVFLPEAALRYFAMKQFGKRFEIVLEMTRLRYSATNEARTLYSLRAYGVTRWPYAPTTAQSSLAVS